MSFYEDVVGLASSRCTSSWPGVAPLKVRRFDTPNGLKLKPGLFNRLNTAYGLSFDSFDIGQIRAPSEIDDMPPAPKREPRPFISKDQV